MSKAEIPAGPVAHDTEVDLLVIGSGTGLAAALSAEELGLDVLVAEKANVIGGSTALSGGAYWVPANPALIRDGSKTPWKADANTWAQSLRIPPPTAGTPSLRTAPKPSRW